jgi:hypothetical protein
MAMMPEKRLEGKIDPSRGPARSARGTAADARDDPAGLPGSADNADSRDGAPVAGLAGGTPDCSSGVPGHSARRSRTEPGNSGKDVAEVPLRRAPPPWDRAGGTRQRQPFRGTLEPALISDLTKVAGTPPLKTTGFLLPLSRYNNRFPGMIGRMTRACGADDVASAEAQKATLLDDC